MGLVTLALAVTGRSTRFHPNALLHTAFIHTLAGDAHDHLFVIYSIMMWRGNLRISQLLQLSHFLTSADLGFEEISCSKKCMFVASPPLISRSSFFYFFKYPTVSISSLLQFTNTLDPHIVTLPIPYDDYVIYACFYIAHLQYVRLWA